MEVNEESINERKTARPQEPVSPEQQKMNILMQRLIEANTTLIVKTAACDCKKKGSCKVYLQSQEIAKIIDELQELRPR